MHSFANPGKAKVMAPGVAVLAEQVRQFCGDQLDEVVPDEYPEQELNFRQPAAGQHEDDRTMF